MNYKHGQGAKGNRSSEYRAWQSMKERCYNANFLEDVKEKPGPKCSLERLDTNGNYKPGNVEWATHTTQIRNRNNTIFLTYNNITKSLAEWAEEKGVKYVIFYKRYVRNWSVESLLNTPVLEQYQRR